MVLGPSPTQAEVGRCEAGVPHPADQRRARRPDAPLAVVDVVDVSSVQALQVGPEKREARQHYQMNLLLSKSETICYCTSMAYDSPGIRYKAGQMGSQNL